MSIRTIRELELCPFTFEAFQDCCISKAGYPRKMCPFSLEPCLQNAKALTKLKQNLRPTGRLCFRQYGISIGKEALIQGNGDHKNHL